MSFPSRQLAKATLRPLSSWRPSSLAASSPALRAISTANTAQVSQDELDRARTYCLNTVRKHDSPAFTLQAFVPPSAQTAYLALRAFNIETALVADASSTPTIASMRMQFWRDTVSASLAGRPPKEPVALLLAAAHADLQSRNSNSSSSPGRGLSKTWLLRIIETRARQLGNPPIARLADAESYAEGTASALLYLTLQSVGLASLTADHLASHVGKATGLAALLRGLPLLAFPPPPNTHNAGAAGIPGGLGAPQGAVVLPLDVMAEAGVVEEQVLRQRGAAPGLRDAVFAVATRANDHLITVREMLKNLAAGRDAGHAFEHADADADERMGYTGTEAETSTSARRDADRARPVLMQAVATQLWLDRLQKVDFDVFDERLRRSDWRLPWKAYWAFTRGTI